MDKKTGLAELQATMYRSLNVLSFVTQTLAEETPAPDLPGDEFRLAAGVLARRMEYFTSTLWYVQQDLERVQAGLEELEANHEH